MSLCSLLVMVQIPSMIKPQHAPSCRRSGVCYGQLQRASCDAAKSRAFTVIPTIDIGPLVSSSSSTTERQVVGGLLNEACTDVGFFYVKNHGVTVSHEACVYAVSEQDFYFNYRRLYA